MRVLLVACSVAVVGFGSGPGCTGSTPAGSWPNEPAGFTVISDWGLDRTLPTLRDVAIPGSPDWNVVYNPPPGTPSGWADLASDPSAPLSPPNVYRFVYPQGMVDGAAPATVYKGFSGTNELYIGYWWKPSSPFQVGPNGTKISFVFMGNNTTYVLFDGTNILFCDASVHLHPNVTATPITLGQWHKLEFYLNVTTSTVRWWVDGVLNGNYSFSYSGPFTMFQFSPTFGGNVGATKTETDYYWFDHVHLSRP